MLAPHEAYSVSSLVALREVNSLKTNMTKAQAEIVLGSFVAKGWLLRSRQVHPGFWGVGRLTATKTRPLFTLNTHIAGASAIPQKHVSRGMSRMRHLLRGEPKHSFKVLSGFILR
jgi:hypothetical protein